MVGEVCEYDELAGLFQKIDTVRITTSEEVLLKWSEVPMKSRGFVGFFYSH